jgi:hypothetical protein
MKVKSLQWKCVGAEEKQWIGEVKDNTQIRFVLEELNDGKYLIQPNLDGIRKLVVRNLVYAKFMAQEQFNGYAKNLFDGDWENFNQK